MYVGYIGDRKYCELKAYEEIMLRHLRYLNDIGVQLIPEELIGRYRQEVHNLFDVYSKDEYKKKYVSETLKALSKRVLDAHTG